MTHWRSLTKILIFTAVSGLLSLVVPGAASAQIEPIVITPVIGFSNLGQALNTLMTALLFFGAVAAFGFIALGAFQYVTAGDSAETTKKARQTITNAVVGLILLGLVYVLFGLAVNLIPGLDDYFKSA